MNLDLKNQAFLYPFELRTTTTGFPWHYSHNLEVEAFLATSWPIVTYIRCSDVFITTFEQVYGDDP